MQDRFVTLAVDVDAPEQPLVDLLMANLPDAMSLPFVLFTDADGQWLAGGQGAVHPDHFRETLEELTEAS